MTSNLRAMTGEYLPSLLGVFYATFDGSKGATVSCQIPADIVSSDSLNFNNIKNCVVPEQSLCNNLVTITTDKYKVLGFPVWIQDEKKYERKCFQFNFCFVFERKAELMGYEPVVRKTGRVLKTVEENHTVLSRQEISLYTVLEHLYEDLNSYSETSILLHRGSFSYLELKLFPYYANPIEVRDWDVPVAVADLESMRKVNWDVTMYKVCGLIDGIIPVKRIADLGAADADVALVRECIQHLMYYRAVLLTDIFQFSNSYVLLTSLPEYLSTPSSSSFQEDDVASSARSEFEQYVYNGPSDGVPTSFVTLMHLLSLLTPSFSLSEWAQENSLHKYPIDIRRLVSYGVIKGFLRRVYAYPIWMGHNSFTPKSPRLRVYGAPYEDGSPSFSASATNKDLWQEEEAKPEPKDLRKYLDGKHHTDELCLLFNISYKELEEFLIRIGGRVQEKKHKGDYGSVQIVWV
ncbi:nitrogen permease regulator 2 [Atractiella rhizophila]|nr:nitrogen permease regulator 2 [Atractiella rhizophila]KAH8928333.1 nitrogen permease regulator 2 [Atractiella rhizophila]